MLFYLRINTLGIDSLQNAVCEVCKLFSNVVRRITSLLPMRGLSRCLMTHSRRHGYMQFLICEKWRKYVLVICQREPPLSYNSKGHFSSMTLYYFVEAISGRASVT